MAGRRRPWQTAGHVSPRILEILIYSIWRKEVSLIALSKKEIRATGRYGQLILLSGDPLHKIHGVFFFFFVFYVSCWSIRFRAICHVRPTNSASSGENLSNCVHLFRQL